MGARMQAVVMTGVGDGSIRELDRFEPAPADVVVRTLADAVCTIERRIFSGDIAIAFPVIGGHEVSGTVVEAMDNGCGLEAGDRVVLDAVNRCGRCFNCVRGHSHLCDRSYDVRCRGYRMVGGGFAQYVNIPAGRVYRYSGRASPEEAALTEPLACCIHSIERGRMRPGDAILGAGTMEVLHLLLGKMRGAEVLVLDRDRSRLRLGAFRMSAYLPQCRFRHCGNDPSYPAFRPARVVGTLTFTLRSAAHNLETKRCLYGTWAKQGSLPQKIIPAILLE